MTGLMILRTPHEHDSPLTESTVCEDWCVCDDKCMTKDLCLCSNPQRGTGCCRRGWDKVPSIIVEL